MTAQAKLTKRVSAAIAGAAKKAARTTAATADASARTRAAASALERRGAPVQLYLRTVPTPLGPFSLYVDPDGAVRCCHWQRSAPGDAAALRAEAQEVCDTLQSRWYKDAAVTLCGVWAEGALADEAAAASVPGATTAALLTQYFNPPTVAAGRPAELERLLLQVPVVYPPTTPFMAQAWTTLRHSVPSGETISYKSLGVRVNKALKLPASAAAAPRAIGAAMGANVIPIIVPCHRVLSTTNSLRGYGLGLRFKVWLLRHEQATVAAEKLRIGEGVDAVSTAASLR